MTPSQATAVPRDAKFLQSLSDADFYSLMQQELGLQSILAVEHELKNVHFVGSVLRKPSWVNYSTAWKQVLQRVCPTAKLMPKRMVELYCDGVPDEFFRTWMKNRRFASWEEAYDGIQDAMQDPDFHIQYNTHLTEQLQAVKQQQRKPQAQEPAKTKQQQAVAPPAAKPQPAAQPSGQEPANTSSNGISNVNPNFKADLDMNPEKKPCSRCGSVHRYHEDLCTSHFHKDKKQGRPTALSAAEQRERLQKRWDIGFYFPKQISEYTGPTAKEATAQSATAAQRVSSKNSGNGGANA